MGMSADIVHHGHVNIISVAKQLAIAKQVVTPRWARVLLAALVWLGPLSRELGAALCATKRGLGSGPARE